MIVNEKRAYFSLEKLLTVPAYEEMFEQLRLLKLLNFYSYVRGIGKYHKRNFMCFGANIFT